MRRSPSRPEDQGCGRCGAVGVPTTRTAPGVAGVWVVCRPCESWLEGYAVARQTGTLKAYLTTNVALQDSRGYTRRVPWR